MKKRFRKISVSLLVVGFVSFGVMPANAVTNAVTTLTCPSGVMTPNGLNCELPGLYVKKTNAQMGYHMEPRSWGAEGVCDGGASYHLNDSNWPVWFCETTLPGITIPATPPTKTGCAALMVRKDANCYTFTEFASVGTLSPFGTVTDWAKTYLLPAIIALALIGIAVRLGIGVSRKYLNNLKG